MGGGFTVSSRQFSVFRDGGLEKLSFEYVPSSLPHREGYVDALIKYLKTVIDQPGVFSERILITGGSGTGKTVTAKKVGFALEKIAKSHGVELVYAHVNCRATSGKFGLVQRIIQKAASELPLRGYGATELLHALWDYLNERNKLLVLTLDEIDYYIRTTGEDIVYELSRLTNSLQDVPQRLNFVFIARDHSFMDVLSPDTLSKLRPQERMEFPPYREDELRSILEERVALAFWDDAVSDEIINYVARNAVEYGHGDARYGIQLLCVAGLIANRDSSSHVLAEHVREAQDRTDPKLSDEDVMMLSMEEKYILWGLARRLIWSKDEVFLSLDEVEEEYYAVCEEEDRKSVGRAMLHALVQKMKAAGVIVVTEDFRLGLDVRAEVLDRFLTDLFKKKEKKHVDQD
jgi:cell division control protein 6